MKFIYSADRNSLVNVEYIRRLYITEFREARGSETNAVIAELSHSGTVVLLRGTYTKCARALDTFYQAMNTDAPYPELDAEWIDYRK